jgi:hypothetical protein
MTIVTMLCCLLHSNGAVCMGNHACCLSHLHYTILASATLLLVPHSLSYEHLSLLLLCFALACCCCPLFLAGCCLSWWVPTWLTGEGVGKFVAGLLYGRSMDAIEKLSQIALEGRGQGQQALGSSLHQGSPSPSPQ